MQDVAHALLLGLEIEEIVVGGLDLDGDPLGDLHAELGELVDLVRVVGQKAQALHAQRAEDLGADVVLPLVPGKAQGQVGVQGVHALLLELIGPELVDEADAPALLAHVEEHAPPLPLDLPHGGGKLLAAVAAQGAEGVAGEALGVDPAEHVLTVPQVPLHQGHMVLAVEAVHKAVGHEIAVLGGHLGHCHLIHQLVVALAVVLQVLDGDEGETVALRELHELGSAHHGAVLPHDLAAQAAGLQPRQTAQVHGGLGVALPLQDTILFGQQGEHVPRPPEVLRLGPLLHALEGGHRPLRRRNAGGGGHMVDGDGEGRLVVVGVVLDHLGEAKLSDVLLRHGHADEALAVGGHEVDVLGGGELRRADEVALILPIGIVGDQNELALPQVLQGLLDGVKLCHDCFLLLKAVLGQKFLGDAPLHPGLRGGGQELFHILADDVVFQVDQVPRPSVPEDGLGHRVGDGRDGEAVSVHPGHRQADAVHGDGALLHNVAQQVGRGRDGVPHGVVVPADRLHPAHSVHVAGDDVAAEAPARRHGPLQVDLGARPEPGQGGAVQRLMHHVGGEAARRPAGDGEADAVDGDAVPHPGVLQHGVGLDGEDGGAASPVHRRHGAHLLNDPREHGHPPRFPAENPRLRSVSWYF